MSSVVPEGWEVSKLEDRLYRPLAYGVLKPDAFVEDGVPMLRIQDVSISGLNKRKLHRISEKLHLEFKRTQLREGDLVISLVGTIGRVLEITKSLDGANVSRAFGVIGLKDDIDRHYIRQFLTSQKIQDWIQEQAQGNAQKVLNLGELRNLSIVHPPLPEQKKIASILTSVDEVIENTQKQIDKLQDLKKATMNELLTKGIGHTEFKDSELGQIPKSWEVTKFANILDIIAGKGFELKEYSTEGVKLLRIDNVSWGKISWDSCAFLPYEYLESEKKLILAEHDLLLALNRPITQGKLKLARCTASDVPAILYQRVGKITSINEDICTNNFAFYLLNQYLPDFIKGESVGSDQPFINLTALRGLMLPLPSRCEQDRMYESMNAIDIGIDRLTKKLCQTQSLKKSLMQDLLTGKVRVTVN